MKKQNFIPLIIGSYYNIFFIGMYYVTRGLLLPQIQKFYQIDNTTSGLIFLIPIVPCLIVQFLNGYIFKVFDKQKVLLASAILLFIGSLALPLSANFTLFLIFSIINSLSIVVCGTGSSIAIIDVFEKRYPEYKNNGLNLYHFSYSLGAVLSLLFMTLYAKNLTSWQNPLVAISLSAVIIILSFTFAKYPQSTDKEQKESFSTRKFLDIIKHPLMISYAILSLLYAGIEGGIGNWISVFLENGYNESKTYSSFMFLLFFIFLTIGRLAGSLLIHKLNKYRLVFIALLATLTCMIFAFGFRIKFLNIDIFIPLCGLCLSVIFPTFQSFLADDFKDELSISNSIFFAGNMIGGTVLLFFIGVANDLVGVRFGLLSTAVFTFTTIPFYILISKSKRTIDNSQSSKKIATAA